MTHAEYCPTPLTERVTVPEPLPGMDLWHMCGLRSAWIQIGMVAHANDAMPPEDYIRETLTSRGVPDEYHGLRPGARLQYTLPDGGSVCATLARDQDWLTHSYREIPGERYAYEQAMARLDNEVMTLTVEVPLQHTLIRRADPEMMRIPMDAREVGLLADEPGNPSRLRILDAS